VNARHLEQLTTNGRWLMLCGLGLIFIGRSTGHGIITGLCLAQAGAFFASLQMWRWERGLWMLAAMFMITAGFEGVLMTYGQAMDLRMRATASLDSALASCLLWFQAYVCALVTRWNRHVKAVTDLTAKTPGVWDQELDG
jgi:hypothetical protein